MDEIIKATEAYVRQYMSHNDSSHDFSHITRVLRLAQNIAARETCLRPVSSRPYDTNIIALAALLHDVGDRKYIKSTDGDPATLVLNFLLSINAPPDLAHTVQEICTHVSYSSEIADPEKVRRMIEEIPELAVVQDADRLDALGAVGIGRCFHFAAVKEVKEGGKGMEDAVRHFGKKLVRLEGWMKTETGREMARIRTERLREYVGWWKEEVAGPLGRSN